MDPDAIVKLAADLRASSGFIYRARWRSFRAGRRCPNCGVQLGFPVTNHWARKKMNEERMARGLEYKELTLALHQLGRCDAARKS